MNITLGEEPVVKVVIPPSIAVVSIPSMPIAIVPSFKTVSFTVDMPSNSDMHVPALPGPRGDKGDKGDSGRDGTGSGSFQYVQALPSAVWVIEHNLEFKPAVTVIDSAGTVVFGEVSYSGQTITISFSAGFSGSAYLS